MDEIKDDLYDDYDYYDEIGADFDDSNDDLHEDEESDMDNDYQEEEELEVSESSTEVSTQSDWERYGLNKTYSDAQFDINKANSLLYTFKTDVDSSSSDFDVFDSKSQIEAIRYATYFAKRNDNDAKNFIIDVIQKADKGQFESDPGSVGDVAKYAFWLIFRNYVRVEIKKFYLHQGITEYERSKRMGDALQHCFAYIFEHIDDFNPSIAKINTFFSSIVIRGVVLDWEALRKGRPSKQTMRTDKLTANAIEECKEQGINPSTAVIASLINKSYNEVQTSRARMRAENTMSTYDVPNLNNKGGYATSETFTPPEQKMLEKENTKELIDNLSTLTDQERELLFMHLGITCNGKELYDAQPLDSTAIEKLTGIDKDTIQRTINMAMKKLKKKYHVKAKRGNDLLSGRGLVFEQKEDNFLDDIIDIK